MPSSIKQVLVAASGVLGVAVILLVMATTMVLLGVTGQASVKAPQLSSTETKPLPRGDTDFWLRDHQQFRRTFLGSSPDRLR